eukprot:TRINITY_DN10390_c0_g1_i1.p1 TRINITY_DN10390_c0_g1~~TRINITY_DN10390_c0_g1_i1.p1  ORF type:complete len:148 (+),score=22.52 TRINITY_DN10390_c0_g1_i1:25-468(+)
MITQYLTFDYVQWWPLVFEAVVFTLLFLPWRAMNNAVTKIVYRVAPVLLIHLAISLYRFVRAVIPLVPQLLELVRKAASERTFQKQESLTDSQRPAHLDMMFYTLSVTVVLVTLRLWYSHHTRLLLEATNKLLRERVDKKAGAKKDD